MLRATHNFTQDQLADMLEARQTIISLEKEKCNPLITLAFKLAIVFKCRIEDIFIYEGEIHNEKST
ncbi:helix-turn-helix transcriptional regulator [Viridibacillus arvi]|uniref:helix-turn-helix transcriptional regulator n=1 Tax=Viridibacillus arvi TaxID=263475 RepID=UPI0026B21B81